MSATKRTKLATRSLAFQGTVRRVERGVIQYVVTVPRTVSEAFATRKAVPVVATIHGVEAHLTLVPEGGGRHKLIFNQRLRKQAGIPDAGPVRIRLVRDEAPPVEPIAPDLEGALREADALAAFESLARSHRNALLRWFEGAVADKTRAKRIARIVEIALEKREKAQDRGRAATSAPRRRTAR